jgi:hypothetical protein
MATLLIFSYLKRHKKAIQQPHDIIGLSLA